MTTLPNHPAPANSAITLLRQTGGHLRGVAERDRWAEP